MRSIITIQLVLFCCFLGYSQVNYNAHTSIPVYRDPFMPGTNLGYHGTYWTDEELADIAAGNPALGVDGIGMKTLRPALFGWFLEYYGYDIRVPAFDHYASLGLRNHTAFIGYPSAAQRDWTEYCAGAPSEVFKDLYLPIWDNGENGTPVNDDNDYALYVYNTVTHYKDYVKFWEVWNEPDVDILGNAYKSPGEPGNYWENIPSPCELPLKAPIYSYIRMLRISYEVIKSVDPHALVAVGGIGYPSYLDLLLRLTDNPVDGSYSADYPTTGGAYFDVLSFHCYPQYDLKEWNNDTQWFDFSRHSDAAIEQFSIKKDGFEVVLEEYGYNDATYPEKYWIVTETNIPRVSFNNFIGSDLAQLNYNIKVMIQAQKENIKSLYMYNLAEGSSYDGIGGSEFAFMGLYEKLEWTPPYQQEKTWAGIGLTTYNGLLENSFYDAYKTNLMELPDHMDGAAFLKHDGTHIYALWAKTTEDASEGAYAEYSFPEEFDIQFGIEYKWDYSITDVTDTLLLMQEPVYLDGTPRFIEPTKESPLPIGLLSFTGKQQDRAVLLEWLTEYEEDNALWEIQYSRDREEFVTIGQKEGAGTVNYSNFYTFIHQNPVAGNNYYRLKQIDFNGAFTFSEIINVPIDIDVLFKVRPTISSDFVYVDFYADFDRDVPVDVVDVFGRVRSTQTLKSGENFMPVDISKFEPGHYFIRMKIHGEGYFTNRFVKIEL